MGTVFCELNLRSSSCFVIARLYTMSYQWPHGTDMWLQCIGNGVNVSFALSHQYYICMCYDDDRTGLRLFLTGHSGVNMSLWGSPHSNLYQCHTSQPVCHALNRWTIVTALSPRWLAALLAWGTEMDVYGKCSWWCHPMETFSTLLALCVGNSLVTGEFPSQRPVTWSFDVFFDLRLNKPLSKQSWG